MTKSEFIHVIVRMSGVVLVTLAAWSFLAFLSGLMLLSGKPATPASISGPFVFDAIIRMTFEVAAGFYLMVDGRLLYSILNYERND